jgi:hypothetical protein
LFEKDSPDIDYSSTVEKLFGTHRVVETPIRLYSEQKEDSHASENKPASPSSSFLKGTEVTPAVALFREQYFEERKKKTSQESTSSLVRVVEPLKSQIKGLAPRQEQLSKKYQDILLNSKLPASTKRLFQATLPLSLPKKSKSANRKTSISSRSDSTSSRSKLD